MLPLWTRTPAAPASDCPLTVSSSRPDAGCASTNPLAAATPASDVVVAGTATVTAPCPSMTTFCGTVSGNVSPAETVAGPSTTILVLAAGEPTTDSARVIVLNAHIAFGCPPAASLPVALAESEPPMGSTKYVPLLGPSHAVQMLFTHAGVAPEQAPSEWQSPGTHAALTQRYGTPASPPYAASHSASSVVVTQGPHALDAHNPLAARPASVPNEHAVFVPVHARLPSNEGPSFAASALETASPAASASEAAASFASFISPVVASPTVASSCSVPPSAGTLPASEALPSRPPSCAARGGFESPPPHP